MSSAALELTLEKLQLIATAKASPSSKIKWLQFFNASPATREARRLPPKLINEERLTIFLAKACWWAGVSFMHSTLLLNIKFFLVDAHGVLFAPVVIDMVM